MRKPKRKQREDWLAESEKLNRQMQEQEERIAEVLQADRKKAKK